MANLCIIPARGGSKRIPKKNIKFFLGKPIIAYSIEKALKSGLFDKVIVSTDDKEIIQVSKKYGADVPFIRSRDNSNDFATTLDVVEEVLSQFKMDNTFFDKVCCLYPCSPLLEEKSLIKACNALDSHIDAVVPIVPFSFPIQRAFKIEKGLLRYFEPIHEKTRSQDLERSYHDAGQFYFFKPEAILKEQTLVPKNTTYTLLDEMEVQDIDNPSDWVLAEIKYKLKTNGISNEV
ncbi:pseudaminic acid cytidylyltransferase [Sediminicola luteus]|uniref:Pseudaminic acid cytidylyltransferase n=1 Tax=Sediminicola luteus TaxID=319238 RepID=A0A2A4GC76_9FLAO|nr:pseudaminic acid cytidylyltransferase [Sediminicola luteus]PCE66559.1 pseudaminic acid cytidylyltransferase [Sediminicola luteus]